MNKRELIYTVFEKLNILSDDSNITEELVSSLIDTKRAMLLKQQYAKSAWHMPIEIKQELCMDLTLTNKVDGYSCAGKMLTTSVSLPRSIKIKGKEGPLAVRKQDGTEIALTIVAIERLPFLFNNRYTQHLTYCAVDFSGKLLIISKDDKHKFLKTIRVTDIFEDPDTASTLTCDYDPAKDSWDIEYPIEAAMADVAIDLVVKELTRSLGIPGDNTNDATDERKG
jgi:hypothetical protein